jgi:uncharacterized protein (TIGR00255 family)
MKSMTGFGQAAGEAGSWRLSVSIRGVNHRALDVVVRGRQELGALEPALRAAVGQRVARGRVELNLDWQALDPAAALARPSQERLLWLRARAAEMVRTGALPEDLSSAELLRWPGVLDGPATSPLGEAELAGLLEIAAHALEQFDAGRCSEGRSLAAILGERLGRLREVAVRLRSRREVVRGEMARQFEERVAEILRQVPADPVRVAQEVAFLAERSDVREELDRLDAHLVHFGALMEEAAPGRRLDFLTQEILRELNTVGSKARDLETARAVLEGKELCEQLREQVQNVE